MMNKRKGISIITVLMFMLVATIAATATFKWLTSEGFSSKNRMLVNEARASALAGVEAARAWMTYHGNETGAIIKQFYDTWRTNRVKTPIRLDDVLSPMAKATQEYTVSVVDVEDAGLVYKIKVLAKGTARGGEAEYTQASVFSVSGLYQVPLPQPQPVAPYHYAYFGGSTTFAGGQQATSMVINGNWGGQNGANPGVMAGDFIVTGNATLNGNNIDVGGTACIGGNFRVNNGLNAHDLYVAGNIPDLVAQISGDAYIEGNAVIANPALGFDVVGNATFNGQVSTNLPSFNHFIGGNLCLGDNGSIRFRGNSDSHLWDVGGSVFMPKSYNGSDKGITGAEESSKAGNRHFGGNGSTVMIKDAFKCRNQKYCEKDGKPYEYNGGCSNGATEKTCTNDMAFQQHKNGTNVLSYSVFSTSGDVKGSFADGTKPTFACAEGVKTFCYDLWRPDATDGCDGSSFKVDDLLTTSELVFSTFDLNRRDGVIADCKNINNISAANTTRMNQCYTRLNANQALADQFLFNGFAVFRLSMNSWESQNQAQAADKSDAPQLDGNFIFIFEEPVGMNAAYFPRTTPNSRVFVYMEQGSPSAFVQCGQQATYNYFFYTERSFQGMMGSCTWNGSFYARAANCAGFGQVNGNMVLNYDANVVNDIFNAGIVCSNDGTPCNGNRPQQNPNANNPAAANPGDPPPINPAVDDMYVAIGDHLVVTVESEYKSKEEVADNAEVISPALVVSPRIIYLPQNAVGKLSDYYSVLPLNGLQMNGQTVVQATGNNAASAPPVNGNLIPRAGETLNAGFYDYTYTYSVGGVQYTSDFHVQVMGAAAAIPMVHFRGAPFVQLDFGAPAREDVELAIGGADGGGQFSVRISVSDIANGWSVTNPDGSPVQWQYAADGSRFIVYNGNVPANDQQVRLFRVTTDANAGAGNLRFTLQSPNNCLLGGGSIVKAYNIRGTATVHRGSLSDYCAKYTEICSQNSDSLRKAANLERCKQNVDEWVKVDCIGSNTVRENEEWTCDAGVGAANVIKLRRGEFDGSTCILYLPSENNYVDNPQDDKSHAGGYALYAELKRKPYRLHIQMEGQHVSGTNVSVGVSETFGKDYKTVSPESCVDGLCTYVIYAGQTFKATVHLAGDDDFSKWVCHNCTGRGESGVKSGFDYEHIMSQDFNLSAVFNEKDEHCFYTEFTRDFEVWCQSDKIQCINYCDGSKPCSVLDGHNAYTLPNWVVVNRTGDDMKPGVGSGFVTRGSSTTPVVMLSSVTGGSEGDFTVRAQAGVEKYSSLEDKNKVNVGINLNKAGVNSGLIVRSNNNASEYIIVNVFGGSLVGLLVEETYARVCYVKDGVAKNCQRKFMDSKNLGIKLMVWGKGDQLNFEVNVDGDSIHVSCTYAGTAALYEIGADFDLVPIVNQAGNTLNDDAHNRVGLKFGESYTSTFGVYDATWHSKKYSEECFADPRVFCSFTAKYMAGQIPLNETVSPSIGYSSWFVNKGSSCATNISYYYNGCDMPSNNLGEFLKNATYCFADVCSDGLVENFLGNDGTRMNDNNYLFRCEGAHGFRHATRNGYVRNASVEVNCNRVNGKKYQADCGEFYVGEQHNCQKDETILDQQKSGNTWELVVDAPPGEVYNVRDADLVFDLTMDAGVTVTVTLEDVNKNKSDAFTLTHGGENRVAFETFASRFGFNPEKLKKVRLKGSNGYTINTIESRCSHSLKVYCGQNDAQYDGGMWRIKANIQPFESARKCYVKANGGGVDKSWFGDCNETGVFFIDDDTFLSRVNEANGDFQVDFTVAVFDDGSATETSIPTASCVASSQTYMPVHLTCDLGGTKREFGQGAGVPPVEFSTENCPASGCEFGITLSDGSSYNQSQTKTSGSVTWTAPVNVATKLAPGTYSYQVSIYSDAQRTKEFRKCTTPSFTVVEAKKATATCRVENNEFVAFVQGSNYEPVSATLIYTDMIGNPFTTQTVEMDANDYVRFPLNSLADGRYTLTLTLNGETACADQVYSREDPSTAINLTCPANVTGQSKDAAIVVTPTVTGCDGSGASCSMSVTPGSGYDGIGYRNGQSFSFYDMEGSGTKTYTLKLTKLEKSKTCDFTVAFGAASSSSSKPASSSSSAPPSSSSKALAVCAVNKSEVTEGDQVTFTVSNIVASGYVRLQQYSGSSEIYNSKGYWNGKSNSKTTTMNTTGVISMSAKVDGKDACSAQVVVKPKAQIFEFAVNKGLPTYDKENIPSGSCFRVKGTWDNRYYLPELVLRCEGNGNMWATSGSTRASGSWSVALNTGKKIVNSSCVFGLCTTETYINGDVCVYTEDGSPLRKCNFGG